MPVYEYYCDRCDREVTLTGGRTTHLPRVAAS
jgi:predicted nucleic acid-binding Zn ribbon protein